MKISPIYQSHPVWKRLGLIAILSLSLPGITMAASFHSTWTGGGDGSSWSGAGNWSTVNAPQDGGGDIYHAYVNNGAGNVSIITSGNVTTRGLTLTQGAGGSTTLKLGGNYQVSEGGFTNGSGVFNTSGSASGVVLDLNGHQFSLAGVAGTRHNFNAGSYTIRSSAIDGSGVFLGPNFAEGAAIVVENKVTIKLVSATPSYLTLTTWSADSTLQLASTGGGNTMNATAPVLLGNLIVGDSGNNAASVFSINNTNITVRGNVTLESFVGATGGSASRLSFSSASQSLRVGGNFTDYGTDNSHYGSNTSATGTIYFIGGSSAERTVSIGRTGLRNAFQVGDTSADGNIALLQNLQTMGGVTVKDNSRLNVQSFTLQSAAFTAEAGATIGFREGGLIKATTLTINSFNLELLGDWSSLENGEDVLLFTYTTLVGTPTVASITGPQGFSYGGIYLFNGGVYLDNVVIPEPGTWALMGVSGLLILSRIRRRA